MGSSRGLSDRAGYIPLRHDRSRNTSLHYIDGGAVPGRRRLSRVALFALVFVAVAAPIYLLGLDRVFGSSGIASGSIDILGQHRGPGASATAGAGRPPPPPPPAPHRQPGSHQPPPHQWGGPPAGPPWPPRPGHPPHPGPPPPRPRPGEGHGGHNGASPPKMPGADAPMAEGDGKLGAAQGQVIGLPAGVSHHADVGQRPQTGAGDMVNADLLGAATQPQPESFAPPPPTTAEERLMNGPVSASTLSQMPWLSDPRDRGEQGAFPAAMYQLDKPGAVEQRLRQMYPDGDPHKGIIPPAKLRLLEHTLSSAPPVRRTTLAAARSGAHSSGASRKTSLADQLLKVGIISPAVWQPHRWSARTNGSRTTFADTDRAAEQPLTRDWRVGAFAGWRPPLEELSRDSDGAPTARVQHEFEAPHKYSGSRDDQARDALLQKRQTLVRNAFIRSWEGYKRHAWGHDELRPVSNRSSDPFNGWGATIVDSMDTLLIMDLPDEYEYARQHVREIDFHVISGGRSAYAGADGRIPVFETTIRYMGGLLGAYDLTGDTLMRDRAEELAQLLIPAFGTVTGVPLGRIRIGDRADPPVRAACMLSEAGSMTLEFTRLWQVTGNRTYFDHVQRITDWLQNNMTTDVRLGTLLPTFLLPETGDGYGTYTIGGMSDSYWEYLIKESHLLGGKLAQYKDMYADAAQDFKKHIFLAVPTVPGTTLLIPGEASAYTTTNKMEHLSCFAGGMVGLGARILSADNKLAAAHADDLVVARHLTESCYWAYNSTWTGLGPEEVSFYKPEDLSRYDRLANGSTQGKLQGNPQIGVSLTSPKYLNRPESIESIVYMWRLTGDPIWQERGWQMFASWVTHCATESGFSSINDVNSVPAFQGDNMESFVFAETFKYYYLLFSPPDLISLDDYVFTTEAHPLLVPKGGKWTPPNGGPKKFWFGAEEDESLRLEKLAAKLKGPTRYLGGEQGQPGGPTLVQINALIAASRKFEQDQAAIAAEAEAAIVEEARQQGSPRRSRTGS